MQALTPPPPPASIRMYRAVQLDSTPEMEVFYMLFQRYYSEIRKGSIKQHTEYFPLLNQAGPPCTLLQR